MRLGLGDRASFLNGPVHGDVNVVGNTIDKTPSFAIDQRNNLTVGGHLALDVFNNIISHHKRNAFALDAGRLTFRAGSNDYYANTVSNRYLDGQSLGSGNRHDNPRFVDRAAGDLRLKSTSPLIDKGVVCSTRRRLEPGCRRARPAEGLERGHGCLRAGCRVAPRVWLASARAAATRLEGTSGDDILCGYAGNDTLRGKGGRDYLDGGSDNDRLVAGSGPDRSYGGSGKDTLCSNDGVHGNDRADGGSGTDKGRTDSGDTGYPSSPRPSC